MSESSYENRKGHTYSYYIGKTKYPFAMYGNIDPTYYLDQMLFAAEIDKFFRSLRGHFGIYVYVSLYNGNYFHKCKLEITNYNDFCDMIAHNLLELNAIFRHYRTYLVDHSDNYHYNCYQRELSDHLAIEFTVDLTNEIPPYYGFDIVAGETEEIMEKEYHKRYDEMNLIEVW